MAENTKGATKKKKITVAEKKPETAKAPESKKGRGGTQNKKNADVKPSERLKNKILPYVFFVIAFFLLVCFVLRDVFGFKGVENNLLGPIGEGIHVLFFGLFGWGAYLVIAVFVYFGFMWRKLVDRRRIAVKLILASVITLLFSALCQVFVSSAAYPGVDLLWNGGNDLVGGGLLGGSLGWLLFIGLSFIGSTIVIILVILPLALLFFDLTPHNMVIMIRAKSKMYAERRAEKKKARLEAEERNAKEEEQRAQEAPEVYNDEPFIDDELDGDAFIVDGDKEEDPIEEPELVVEETSVDEHKNETFKLESVFNENATEKEELGPPIDDGGDALLFVDTEETVEEEAPPQWTPPPIDLLVEDQSDRKTADLSASIAMTKKKLYETLESFDIRVKDIGYSIGPTITRYEVVPEAGVRVRAIANLVDDIAMNLATVGVRIEAPIPNKPAVGVEVPNEVQAIVHLRSLIEAEAFNNSSPLTVCLGQDVAGKNVFFDIKKMPHMIIAGTTGSGKSVCINCIVCSLLYKNPPDKIKLIMIDPKKVEFSIYQHIPHLYCPIISDPRKAAGALASAVAEMERRYTLVEDVGVRDVDAYNQATANDPDREYLPKLIIVIDELADLMMMAKADVEQFITRIAQKARAVGIHLIIGTQRPSVDVITGLIKANVPSRIACTVKSQVDSRTIIDIAGAEKLIGHGDMLFSPVGLAKPMRVQGAFLQDEEVSRVVDFIKTHNAPVVYNSAFMDSMEAAAANVGEKKTGGAALDAADMSDDNGDAKFRQAVDIAIKENKISTSLLQRKLEIGYGRAAKIIDRMEELGYVSEADGNKPRRILITAQEFYEKVVNNEVTESDE